MTTFSWTRPIAGIVMLLVASFILPATPAHADTEYQWAESNSSKKAIEEGVDADIAKKLDSLKANKAKTKAAFLADVKEALKKEEGDPATKYEAEILRAAKVSKADELLKTINELKGKNDAFGSFAGKLSEYHKLSLPTTDAISALELAALQRPILFKYYVRFLYEQSPYYYFTFGRYKAIVDDIRTRRDLSQTPDQKLETDMQARLNILKRYIISLQYLYQVDAVSFMEIAFEYLTDDEPRIRGFAEVVLGSTLFTSLPEDRINAVFDKVGDKLKVKFCEELATAPEKHRDLALKRLGDTIVADDSAEVREAAAKALGDSKHSKAIGKLAEIAALGDAKNNGGTANCMKALNALTASLKPADVLNEYSETTVEKILGVTKGSKDSDPESTANGIEILGTIGNALKKDNAKQTIFVKKVVPELSKLFDYAKGRNQNVATALRKIGLEADTVTLALPGVKFTKVSDLLEEALFNSQEGDKAAIHAAIAAIRKTDKPYKP